MSAQIVILPITPSERSWIYSREIVQPRVEPRETPLLTEYSYKDFPSRTTWSHLLLRKDEIRPNIRTEIPQDVTLSRKTSMTNLVKNLKYIKCYSLSSPRLIKNPGNSVRCNFQKICSGLLILKICNENQEKDHIFWSDQA